MIRAFHGTPHIEQVLQEGLRADMAVGVRNQSSSGDGGCPHVWLAKRREDAAQYGDVVEIDVTGFGPWPTNGDDGDWQACYHGGDIGPDRLQRAPPLTPQQGGW